MNILEIQTKVKIHDSVKALSSDEQELIEKAIKAIDDAYAPYSNFRVGAALLLEDGTILSGSNQENASFPVGLCAERVALANKAANNSKQKIKTIAIAVNNARADTPVPPCGMCRQALFEEEKNQQAKIKVLLKGFTDEVYEIEDIGSLLPLAFSSGNL